MSFNLEKNVLHFGGQRSRLKVNSMWLDGSPFLERPLGVKDLLVRVWGSGFKVKVQGPIWCSTLVHQKHLVGIFLKHPFGNKNWMNLMRFVGQFVFYASVAMNLFQPRLKNATRWTMLATAITLSEHT